MGINMKNSEYVIEHVCDSGKRLLINMLSGRTTEKTDNIRKVMEIIESGGKEDALAAYEREVEELSEKKFIFRSEEERDGYMQEVLKKASGSELKSWTFFLHLTYDCNLSCTYCNYKDIPREQKFMTQEGLQRAFEVMEKVSEEETGCDITVVLFGGEPFLPNNRAVLNNFFIKFKNFKEKNSRKGTDTNLLAFSNGVEIINNERLLSENKDMITSIYVTVNGPDFVHNRTRRFPDGAGSYEKTLEGISRLLKLGIPTWMVTNISKDNIGYLPFIHSLIEEKGFHKYTNFLGCCVSRIKDRFEETPGCLPEHEFLDSIMQMNMEGILPLKYFNFEDMRILKNIMALFGPEGTQKDKTGLRNYCIYGCGNRINQYTFAADGLVYPCSASAGNLRYAIGRLGEEEFVTDGKEDYWTRKPVWEKSRCKQCKMAFVCGGGCILEGREKNKSWDKPYCPEAEKIVHSYFRCLEKGISILNRETVYETADKNEMKEREAECI